MKIYFDFDRTLFDTEAFLKELYRILKEYNIPIDLFDKIKNEEKEKGFNSFKILEKIKRSYSFSTGLYHDLENFIECDSMYLFNDSVDLLKYLKSKHFELILLTKGDYNFQKVKIDNTNIDEYFDDIIITNKHKGELAIDYNAIFIDDSIEEIDSILKNNPKMVIHIDRYNKDTVFNKKYLTIHSLSELYKIIKD